MLLRWRRKGKKERVMSRAAASAGRGGEGDQIVISGERENDGRSEERNAGGW